MSKIRIMNFGPIKEGNLENDGWIDIKKVTVFIGNQASGKSTVAKAISTLSWLEKSINRADIDSEKLSFHIFMNFFKYHKIDSYFSDKTYLEYIGEKYSILYDRKNEFPIFREITDKNYIVPKISYIPAERNFLSTIRDAFNVRELPGNLFSFAEKLRKAQNELNGKKLKLPIGNYNYEYDQNKDTSFVTGHKYRINLIEASSGLQSYIPLYIVSKNLSTSIFENQEKLRRNLTVEQSVRFANEIMNLTNDNSLKDNERNKKIEVVKARYFNKCFQNIVEEPEQNLFPTSQKNMLFSLLEFNNLNNGNRLIITTHSPYILNYLTLAVEANRLKKKVKTAELKNKLKAIVPLNSTVDPDDLAIYQLDENDGSIKLLGNYKGLPSDENKLNENLAFSNDQFSELLDIEDLCQ
ncbi:MAG: ATP-binding protein [Bacteroidota bacterium]|nr:ATP-binding protein [Bacteroidota bacterium]MDP3431833.1 ATP-binding protein [Bacteroidota bacterium]